MCEGVGRTMSCLAGCVLYGRSLLGIALLQAEITSASRLTPGGTSACYITQLYEKRSGKKHTHSL